MDKDRVFEGSPDRQTEDSVKSDPLSIPDANGDLHMDDTLPNNLLTSDPLPDAKSLQVADTEEPIPSPVNKKCDPFPDTKDVDLMSTPSPNVGYGNDEGRDRQWSPSPDTKGWDTAPITAPQLLDYPPSVARSLPTCSSPLDIEVCVSSPSEAYPPVR